MNASSSDFVIFDTEFTAWEGSRERQWSEPWEQRELIQIAGLRVSVNEGHLTVVKAFDELILPIQNPELSAYIMALTGIQQSELNARGVDFCSAIEQFWQFCGMGQIPVFSWGNDAVILQENSHLNDIELPVFAGGIRDIRPYLRSQAIHVPATNSGHLAKTLGIQLDGNEHNALFDVRSILSALQFWVDNKQLNIPLLLNSVSC